MKTGQNRKKPMNWGKIGEKGPVYIAKVGAVRVNVYREQKWKGGEAFRVIWPKIGEPGNHRKKFNRLPDAKSFANETAKTLAVGGGAVFTLTDDDKRTAAQLRSTATHYNLSLESVFWEYREAKALVGGKSLVEVAREYATIRPKSLTPISIEEAVDQYIQSRELAGRSAGHIRDIEAKLTKFSTDFKGALADISTELLQKWIGSLEIGARSKRNYLTAIKALVSYAQKKNWLSDKAVDLRLIEIGREPINEVGIFKPDELTKLFEACRPEMIPFLALSAWAGLRHSEVRRLTWAEIRFDSDTGFPNGWIEVKAGMAKNAAKLRSRARRLVSMTPTLKSTLQPFYPGVGSTAPVCPFAKTENQLVKLAKAADITWKPNALRHSFGSYRLAILKSEDAVALEMGNTPDVVFRHYRQLVTPGEADKWFGACPTRK